MTLEAINNIGDAQCRELFRQCCASENWVNNMLAQRPFATTDALRIIADDVWADLSENDYLEAFDAHPKIGDMDSLKTKYAASQQLSKSEQSSVDGATESVLQQLAGANNEYEKKFGFIFIVCATGKSAYEMLGLLQSRLHNNRDVEIKNAVKEQQKIFQIRLGHLL